MRGERIFRILTWVDEDLLEEAAPTALSAATAQKRRSPALGRMLAGAACVALVCAVSLAWVVTGGFLGFGSPAPGESPGAHDGTSAGGESAAGAEGATQFLSYAGPVLPLTLSHPGLGAERTVTWDFGQGEDTAAQVQDQYTLQNLTAEPVSATAYYPVSGSLLDLETLSPTVSVDEEAVAYTLLPGPYAGTFQGISGEEGGTYNPRPLSAWTDYETLLSDDAYLAQAQTQVAAPETPVTLYTFSDFQAPTEDFPAASQAITFTLTPETTVLSYGFEGRSWDTETGWRQYSFFVPDGQRRASDAKLLVVLGEDIGDYTLQGYRTGECAPGNELSGVSATVTRRETTLHEALSLACQDFSDRGYVSLPTGVSQTLFQRAAEELLTQYGLLNPGGGTDRYDDGRLDDLLGDALHLPRVLYLAVPVTIPAAGETTVTAVFQKEASFDFGGAGTGNQGLRGYDLLTTAGSNLNFTAVQAGLENPQSMQLRHENFGFSPESPETRISLQVKEPHYYMELSQLGQ